jgi:PTS system nitrogen regulatory IIA component
MNINKLLSPPLVLCQYSASSKKRVLDDIAEHISQQHSELDSTDLLSALIAREKLGSTGIGGGIAIPHCRVPECKDTIGMLLTLDKAIDFDAIDNEPVDIIFVLLVPEDANEDHLKTLSAIAECFSNHAILENVRNAKDSSELLNAITQ